MKSVFIFLGTCGLAAIVLIGAALTMGEMRTSQEVVKEISVK